MMRNFTLLLLLMAAVTFTGCKKDDKEDQRKEIVGKWFLKQLVEKEIRSGQTIYDDTETDFGTDDYIDVKSDGSFYSTLNGDGETAKYEVKSDNILSVTYVSGSVEDYQIKKLNSSELVLYMEDIDGPNDKETIEYTFRK